MTPNSEPEAQVVLLLRAVTMQLNLVGTEFALAHDLHVTDLRAIIELLDAERAGIVATPTWLADRLRLNSASVTALIDRLERMGHVQRSRDTADRRRVHLAVTLTAKQLGLAFFGPLIGRIITAMEEFSEPEADDDPPVPDHDRRRDRRLSHLDVSVDGDQLKMIREAMPPTRTSRMTASAHVGTLFSPRRLRSISATIRSRRRFIRLA